ncbi:MAG: ATP12 family protein [Pseudomonadota bacterium]
MEKPERMKRFYQNVTTADSEGGWQVLLDGRPIKTVGGRPQIVPCAALAEAMAAEWASQGPEISAGAFILRDLADYAIDVVGTDRAGAIGQIMPYGETDTLCYRADDHDPLHLRQDAVWEPLLSAAERRFDARFERVSGIIHRPQPVATLARLEAALIAETDCRLAALRTLAGLAASLVIALAAIERKSDLAMLWNAANLEEDWQAEFWGKDAEAQARQERRRVQFMAAAQFAQLSQAD